MAATPSRRSMADLIDQAIAAAAEPQTVQLIEVKVQISSTGRPVIMAVPVDLTDAEIIELGAFVLVGLRLHIARQLGPASRIIVPGRA
jgi:hypothetical protein